MRKGKKTEWESIYGELPDRSVAYKNLSVDVHLLLANGQVIIGFYAYNYDKWYGGVSCKPIPERKIKGWRYL